MIVTLNQLSEELHATKTDVIEKGMSFFSKQNPLQRHQLLQFAGKLKSSDTDRMLQSIKDDKNSKVFELNF